MSDPLEDLKKEVGKKLDQVGFLLVSEIRQNLNTGQEFIRKGSNFRGLQPSAPGEFPRKLSGQLQKSIAFQTDKEAMEVTVGTNIPHGRFLEFGTKWMDPRGWLFRTYNSCKDRIAKLFRG